MHWVWYNPLLLISIVRRSLITGKSLQAERVSRCYVTPAYPLQIHFSFITFKMAAVPYYSFTPKESKNRVVFGRAKELAPGSTFEFFVLARREETATQVGTTGKMDVKG